MYEEKGLLQPMTILFVALEEPPHALSEVGTFPQTSYMLLFCAVLTNTLTLILLKHIFFIYMCLWQHMYTCVTSAQRVQKRVLDPLAMDYRQL